MVGPWGGDDDLCRPVLACSSHALNSCHSIHVQPPRGQLAAYSGCRTTTAVLSDGAGVAHPQPHRPKQHLLSAAVLVQHTIMTTYSDPAQPPPASWLLLRLLPLTSLQIVGCCRVMVNESSYCQRFGICNEHIKADRVAVQGVDCRWADVCCSASKG